MWNLNLFLSLVEWVKNYFTVLDYRLRNITDRVSEKIANSKYIYQTQYLGDRSKKKTKEKSL